MAPTMVPAIQALDCEGVEGCGSAVAVAVAVVAAEDVIDGSVMEAEDAGVGGCGVLEVVLEVELAELVDVAISRYNE